MPSTCETLQEAIDSESNGMVKFHLRHSTIDYGPDPRALRSPAAAKAKCSIIITGAQNLRPDAGADKISQPGSSSDSYISVN